MFRALWGFQCRIVPSSTGAFIRGAKSLAKQIGPMKGVPMSSQLWLVRQARDPYAKAARENDLRSRAAFKLDQVDEKFKFLRPGLRIADLGAAPGGWSKVAAKKVNAEGLYSTTTAKGLVVAVDLLPIAPIQGVTILQGDMLSDAIVTSVSTALNGKADVVLCDMFPNTSGVKHADHARAIALAEAALLFCGVALRPGGCFLTKLSQGGEEGDYEKWLKVCFAKVQRMKPPASRSESAEFYLFASGFKSIAKDPSL